MAPAPLLRPQTPGQLLGWAALDWAAIVGLWGLLTLEPRAAWLAVPVLGGRFHALGVVLHDLAHTSLKGTALERAVALVCGLPLFTSVEAMRAHHLRHHARTNQPGDPYFAAHQRLGSWGAFFALWLLLPSWAMRSALGTLGALAPPLRRRYARLLLDDDAESPGCAEEVRAAAAAEWPVTLFALLLAAATVRWPTALLLGWWLPLGCTSLFNAARFLGEHPARPAAGPSSAAVQEVTRDHGTSLLARAFVYPHAVGLHRTHHRFPSAGFVHLAALDAWAARQPRSSAHPLR